MKMIKFYDTSSLLLKADSLFEGDEQIVISSITLEELEHIKTSSNKDEEIKYSARKLMRILDEHIGEYEVVQYLKNYYPDEDHSNNDTKILTCARVYQRMTQERVIFVTNDICLKHLARRYFGADVESIEEDHDLYEGYKEIIMSDEDMTEFYSNPDKNPYNLLINEYLIIKNQ